MQRLYPMFPQGWPGVALVLLRMAVAANMAALALVHGRPGIAAMALMLLAVMLLSGVLTPLASCMAALAEVVLTLFGDGWTLSACLLMVDPVLLLLLGPGAYSCDARLFGRRLLTLPD